MDNNKFINLEWFGPVPLNCFDNKNTLNEFLSSFSNPRLEDILKNRGIYIMCSRLDVHNETSIYCINYIGGAPLRSIEERIFDHYPNIKKALAGGYFLYNKRDDFYPYDMLYTKYSKEQIIGEGITKQNIDNTVIYATRIEQTCKDINELIGNDKRTAYDLSVLQNEHRKNYIEQIEHSLINSFRCRAITRYFCLNLELVSYDVPYFLLKNKLKDKNAYILGLEGNAKKDYDIFANYLQKNV